ncbi:THO complex subunit 1 transcription elongation factor-domain-containing protein [Entophlyctis helioformis]|nr:THO complex subunit 1 transcription elongation factor-domain-containing protein [Entophlyctis helioformis]
MTASPTAPPTVPGAAVPAIDVYYAALDAALAAASKAVAGMPSTFPASAAASPTTTSRLTPFSEATVAGEYAGWNSSSSKASEAATRARAKQALKASSREYRAVLRKHLAETLQPVLQSQASVFAAERTLAAFRLRAATIVSEHRGGVDRLLEPVFLLLDLSIEATEQQWAESLLTFSLIEDLLDILTVEAAEHLFMYLDSRSEFLTKDIDPGKRKGLLVLRICNEILRRLSNPNTMCVFPLNERSGTNARGDFNTDNKTIFDTLPTLDEMDVDDNSESKAESKKEREHAVFYNTFWSLQSFFSNPTSAFNPERFETLRKGVEKVLAIFTAQQEAADRSNGAGSDKRRSTSAKHAESVPSTSDIKRDYFFPKFLTSRNLFDLELNSPFFRRQILVQIMIVFQFLGGLTAPEKERVARMFADDSKRAQPNKALMYAYTLDKDQEAWLADCRGRAMYVLERISPNGKQFTKTLITVITHERNWLKWKLESCQTYELPPVPLKHVKLRPGMSRASNSRWLGNDQLTQLWDRGHDLKQVLRFKAQHSKVPALDHHLQDLDYQLEDDCKTLTEGTDEAYLQSNDMRYCWLAYRTALRSHVHLFTKKETSAAAAAPAAAKTGQPEMTSSTMVIDLLREWRSIRARANAKEAAPAEEDTSGNIQTEDEAQDAMLESQATVNPSALNDESSSSSAAEAAAMSQTLLDQPELSGDNSRINSGDNGQLVDDSDELASGPVSETDLADELHGRAYAGESGQESQHDGDRESMRDDNHDDSGVQEISDDVQMSVSQQELRVLEERDVMMVDNLPTSSRSRSRRSSSQSSYEDDKTVSQSPSKKRGSDTEDDGERTPSKRTRPV